VRYEQGHGSEVYRVDENQPFGREGYLLMGAVFEVYNEQGFGLAEEIYQESLERELLLRQIPFHSKPSIQCFYKDQVLHKCYFPDLRIFGNIITELKSVSALSDEHVGQLMNYLRLTHSPIGYLVNFGRPQGVEWRRFILSEYL
jgi:GxxExxY protein